MAKQKKLPAMQFYTGDWMKDPALRSVSSSARGLWIDMLCLMHDSDRRGYLQVNGKPVSLEMLARMTGNETEQVSRDLQELENSGVYSCTEHGTIFCRRMVRDEARRQRLRENGKKGGNPALLGVLDNQDSNQEVIQGVNQERGSSVSTSVSNLLSADSKSEIPESLLDAARTISLMPECQVEALRLDYRDDWIELAIKTAVLSRKRNWHYVRAIMQNWKIEGGPPKNPEHASGNFGSGMGSRRREKGGVQNRENGKYAHIDAANFG